MWSIAVVLPTLQADFGVTRADVSLAYTAVMLGAVVGGPVMGWMSDRFGITVPVAIGTAMLALGLALASQAATMWKFTQQVDLVGLVTVGNLVAKPLDLRPVGDIDGVRRDAQPLRQSRRLAQPLRFR